jgi:hypothetical protein
MKIDYIFPEVWAIILDYPRICESNLISFPVGVNKSDYRKLYVQNKCLGPVGSIPAPGFKSQSGDRLSRVKFFVVFLNPSKEILG